MSKDFRLVEPKLPQATKTQRIENTAWEICIVCKDNTSEVLQCPAESSRSDAGVGYVRFEENFMRFKELGVLPVKIEVERLDNGSGISNNLLKNKAKWHKSCNLKFNSTKLERAEKKRRNNEAAEDTSTKKYTRLSAPSVLNSKDVCFFCDLPSKHEKFHQASTLQLDARVRKCALDLQDKRLLPKVSSGDKVAQFAQNHAKCLAALYNQAAKQKIECNEETGSSAIIHGIVLAELLAYIEDLKHDDDVTPVFKLANLVKLYENRLTQLGLKFNQGQGVHSTRLKNRILSNFSDMSAYKSGRNVVLAFNKDIKIFSCKPSASTMMRML